MKRLALILCLVLGAASAQAPADAPKDLSSLVPADTLLLFEGDDLGGMARWTRETALGRIWAEPEVQQFVEGLKKSFHGAMAALQGGPNPLGIIGLEWNDLKGIEIRRGGVAVIDAGFDEGFHIDAVMALQFRAGADKAAKIVQALRQAMETYVGLSFQEIAMRGRTVWHAESWGYEVAYTMKGDTFVLTSGQARMEQVLQAMDEGNANSLARSERFATAVRRMGASRRAFMCYADVRGVHAKALKIAGRFARPNDLEEFQQGWHKLGLDEVDAVAFADIPHGSGFRSELAVTCRERRGLLNFIPAGQASQRFARHAPAGALIYSAENSDLSHYLNSALEIAMAFDPEDVRRESQEFFQEFRKHLGVDLRADLLAALGNQWAVYAGAPPQGGLIPDFAVFVTVKDRAKLEKSLETVATRLQGIAAEERVHLVPNEALFRGVRIRFVEMAERGGDPIPVAPSWAFIDDYLVLALYPQTIKNALVEKPSLADNQDFRTLLRSVPDSSMNFTYVDTKALVGWLYNTGVPFAQVLQGAANKELSRYNFKLNFQDLPPAEVITRHLGGTMFYTAVEPGCIRIGAVSPFGAPVLAAGVAVAGAAVGAGVYMSIREKRMESVRAARDARGRARLEQARAELAVERQKNAAFERRLAELERQIKELKRELER